MGVEMTISDTELFALKVKIRPLLLKLITILFPGEKVISTEWYLEIPSRDLKIYSFYGVWTTPYSVYHEPLDGDIEDLIVYICKVDYETAYRSLKEFAEGTLKEFTTGTFELDLSSIEGGLLPSLARNQAQIDEEESKEVLPSDKPIEEAIAMPLTDKHIGKINFTANPIRHINPITLPRRDWLYGKHYISQNVSATVSPGGVGKSSLSLAEAVSIATGRNLLGTQPTRCANLWYINGEDPLEEIERRLAAVMLNHHITHAELAGRLFINSGRDNDISITKTERNSMTIYEPMIDALINEIKRNNIEVVILDPFVTIHTANENDNVQMNQVIKALRDIAHRTEASIEVVHHTRKLNGADTSMDDARGASALQGGVRSMRTLSRMQKSDAEKLGIEDHYRYIRVDDAKNNLAPSSGAWWVRLKSVGLPNGPNLTIGDEVGVVEGWQYPKFNTGTYTNEQLENVKKALGNEWHRSHPRATNWVGHIIAPHLGLDSTNKQGVRRLECFIHNAVAKGALKEENHKMTNGNEAPCVSVADWSKLSPPPDSLVG